MGEKRASTVTEAAEAFVALSKKDFDQLIEKAKLDDSEMADWLEFQIRQNALTFVADYAPEPFASIAKAALETEDLRRAQGENDV